MIRAGRSPLDVAGAVADLDASRPAGTGPIGLRAVHIGPDVFDGLPEAVSGLVSSRGPIVVLTDGVPKTRRGVDVTDLAECLAGEVGRRVTRVQVPGAPRVHADQTTIDGAVSGAADAAVLISVGSGTLADIGKVVSARLGGVPHVVVQTALSVNGFADDQSVLLVKGVKRTTLTRWPDILIADSSVLAEAPLALNLAGVGDLLAMFTAPADWRVADLLGMGGGYRHDVVTLVRRHGPALLDAAPRLRDGDPAAIELVAGVLTLSGLAMGAAGSTAPASGAEHTVSHLIEMTVTRRGQENAFHGAQVGVSSVLAACVWAHVRSRLRSSDPELRFPSEEEMCSRVREAFAALDPSGAMGDECWRQYRQKLTRWHAARDRLIAADWAGIDRAVGELLADPAALRAALSAAGAPIRFAELDPPVDPATAHWALANCHLMRDRFSVVDLAFFLGAWEPADVDAVVSHAARLGVGM